MNRFTTLKQDLPRKFVFSADFVIFQISNPNKDLNLAQEYYLKTRQDLTRLHWDPTFQNRFCMQGHGIGINNHRYIIISH